MRSRLLLPTTHCLSALGIAVCTAAFATIASADDSPNYLIEEAIQQDLDDSVRMAGAELKVEASDRHVTLSGTVNSVMDRWRAAEIAKRSAGVLSVLNQIVIKATDRDDEEIHADVTARLKINDSVERPAMTAKVMNGQVTLSGQAQSLAEKRIAEMAAGGVDGVRKVTNELTVPEKTDRTDEDMRDEIAGLFVHSVYLDDVTPEVTVKGGVATLTGNVGSAAQRDFAESLAEVRGVSSVDVSQITIDPELIDPTERRRRYADVSDEEVESAVERSFRFDPVVFHSADQIKTSVSDSVVMLNGVVTRLTTKNKAERLAGDVIGVRRVVNELKVEWPGESPSSMQIIKDVQDAVKRSPYLSRREVRVHCQRAHVSIFGVVESELEKNVAGWLAENVPGVVHVNNRLAVERKWKEKPDDEIQAKLERKLKFALLKTSEDVTVNVEGGVAIIRGEVDTWRQWQTIMDLALEAGARHPHNLVNVRYHSAHGGSRMYIGH